MKPAATEDRINCYRQLHRPLPHLQFLYAWNHVSLQVCRRVAMRTGEGLANDDWPMADRRLSATDDWRLPTDD
jgi:hypothetical protein